MKYKLTKNTKVHNGITLYQIQALKSFGDVKEGDFGGWIEKESNLSQEGNCWVYEDAWVFGNAWVSGNARVFGDARISGDARVYGDAWVFEDARVYGNARVYGDVRVFGNAQVYGDAWVSGNARVYGNARLAAKASFAKGWFIGGDDSEKITNITDQTGSTFWKSQYVLGDYEITPIKVPSKNEEIEKAIKLLQSEGLLIDGKILKN